MVMNVLLATMILLQNRSSEWPDIKRCLGDAQFLRQLKDFDCNTVKPSAHRRAGEWVHTANFNAKYMRSHGSKSCADLCNWIVAVVDTCNRAKEDKTRRDKVDELRNQQDYYKKLVGLTERVRSKSLQPSSPLKSNRSGNELDAER